MTDADKKPFLQAFSRLCVSLREKEPNAAQLKVYFKALNDLDLELVLMAAADLEKTAQWFPKTSEWREAVKKLDKDRTDAQRSTIQRRLAHGLPPLCLACEDTGWCHTDRGVTRCACHQQRRLEVLGRQPLPALPPKSHDLEPDPSANPIAVTAMIAEIRKRTGKGANVVKDMPAAGVYLQNRS